MIRHQDLDLTIIIPTKDRPQFLAAAVRSALANLPESVEVLVVDDRSAKAAADGMADLNPRLRFIVSQAAPGAAGARNWGVAKARGKRILFLDDDDLIVPGYATWVLEQRADYGFSPILRFRGLESPTLGIYAGGEGQPIADVRPFRHQIAGLGCGFWIDRSAFLATGGIAEDIRVNEDTEFSIRLLRAGLRGLRAPAPAVMVRQHGGVGGQRGHLTAAAKAGERAGYYGVILARHADWLQTRPDAARHLLQRQLKLLAQARDRAAARAALASPLARGQGFSLRLSYLTAVISARLRGR
jgi:glycosyltransferase involved in cell wall biosynthesis